MSYQEEKRVLLEQLKKIVAIEKQLREKNKKLVLLKKRVGDNFLRFNPYKNIITQIKYNAHAFQKLRHSEAVLRCKLNELERKKFNIA